MKIRLAIRDDCCWLEEHDHHVSGDELLRLTDVQRVLIAQCGNERIGWLRWNLFWDNTPFMNMLYLLEPYRGRGFGTQLVRVWEDRMGSFGFESVMTSTQSNEEAQHFYRRLGYRDAGSLILPGEPLEIIFHKSLEMR